MESTALARMLEQARRRCRDEALVREGSWAAAAGLAGFCALLLAGTQVLDWRWPASLALAAFAWAAWRVHRATPANDRLALRLDGALDTGDLFATAVHYRDARPAREPDPVFLASLNGSAERSAASVDVSHALPGKWPRSASAAVAGLLAAASLFFLRYGLLHTFDLSAPLAAVEFDTLTGAPAARRKAPPKEMARMNVPGVEPLEIPAEEQSNWTQEQLAEQKMQTVRSPDPTQASRQGQKDISSGQEGDEAQGEDTEGEGSKGSDDPNSPAGATDPSKGGDKSSPKDRGDEKNSSLMDKMRDALANLMDKLKVDSKGGETKTAANKGQQSQKMEKGQNSRGQNQQAEEADPGQQGDQPGEGDSPQQAKSQAGADQDTPSKNEKSGVGKQDGSKDTQLAEQREAMGKLSEVLGKRALNVQGEVMVEVNNSRNQQLKTPYVNRTAQHADSGGDISRDEVPLELRDYVQKYYESVRKPAPAKQ